MVELLVVMGIIGLILTISVPAMTGYAKRTRLKAASRQVMGLLSLARSLAISSHAQHAVVIDQERRELRVTNLESGEDLEQAVHLPPLVTVTMEVGGEASQEARMIFQPSGSLAGRSVSLILADRDTHQTVTVTGVTGAVSIQD